MLNIDNSGWIRQSGASTFAVLLVLAVPATAQETSTPDSAKFRSVAALGRLEPEHGVLKLGVASTPHAISGSVIAELMVKDGDWVEAGQLIATTDSTKMLRAQVEKAMAELKLSSRAAEAARSQAEVSCVLAKVAATEAERRANLLARMLTSTEEAEQAQGDAEAKAASCTAAKANALVAEASIEVAGAVLDVHQAEVERSTVRAPVAGRILEIHARPGEMAGPEGVLDFGSTDSMFAIAEVYETDAARVRVGQMARVTSDAIPQALTGTVERIRNRVQKQDVTGTDPAARKDARIVEVEIRLKDGSSVAGLTNLQVEIIIGGDPTEAVD